jgi:alpha-L-fucosidase
MSVSYDATSPYYLTGYSEFFLDVMVNRPIPKETDDLPFIINLTYQYRPDLLAYDLYGTPTLWWVFYQRNPNTLTAPPLDFKAGIEIYVPKESTLKSTLGY